MNFVQMRAFNAVVRHGSVTAAAQALGVSKPAVTMQIRSLEDMLGIRLFHRKGNALEISDAGRQFLEPVRTMARILDELEGIAERTAGNREGHVRIGACAPFIVVPVIAEFSRRFPGIRTETELNNSEVLADRVQNHELDVAIATLQEPHPDFFSLHLVSQRVQVIVAASHPWAKRRTVALDELAGVPCVMRESGSMTRNIIEGAAAELGIELDTRIEIGSREAVKEAVARDLGIGFVLDREVGRDSGLAALNISGADLESGEYLFCHNDLVGIGSIEEFIGVARDLYTDQGRSP